MAGNTSQLGLGVGIKSTQRGTSGNGTVTITSVNVNKTQLRWLGTNGAASWSIVLASSTSITVSGIAAGSISWELTEFY